MQSSASRSQINTFSSKMTRLLESRPYPFSLCRALRQFERGSFQRFTPLSVASGPYRPGSKISSQDAWSVVSPSRPRGSSERIGSPGFRSQSRNPKEFSQVRLPELSGYRSPPPPHDPPCPQVSALAIHFPRHFPWFSPDPPPTPSVPVAAPIKEILLASSFGTSSEVPFLSNRLLSTPEAF